MNEIEHLNKSFPATFEPEGQFETLKESEKKILTWCEGLVKATALFAFNIGKELTLVKENTEHGKFQDWIEKKFPFSVRTARRYMFFYEKIKTDNLAVLDSRTMTEALRKAKIIAPPKTENGDEQVNFDFFEMFELPAKSERALKNHRTIVALNEIIVFRRTEGDLLTSKVFTHLYEDAPKNPELREKYKIMMSELQEAVEGYLLKVEQEEEL